MRKRWLCFPDGLGRLNVGSKRRLELGSMEYAEGLQRNPINWFASPLTTCIVHTYSRQSGFEATAIFAMPAVLYLQARRNPTLSSDGAGASWRRWALCPVSCGLGAENGRRTRAFRRRVHAALVCPGSAGKCRSWACRQPAGVASVEKPRVETSGSYWGTAMRMRARRRGPATRACFFDGWSCRRPMASASPVGRRVRTWMHAS